MYVLFAICMNTRTSSADIVLIVPWHTVKAWKHFIFHKNYVYFMTKMSTVHLTS